MISEEKDMNTCNKKKCLTFRQITRSSAIDFWERFNINKHTNAAGTEWEKCRNWSERIFFL